MTYITPQGTGLDDVEVLHPGLVLVRKVTESQGDRSEMYETRDATAKGKPGGTSKQPSAARGRPEEKARISRRATSEHVERLLREWREVADRLIDAMDDPIASGLLGSSMVNLLQELWGYRDLRGDDWADLLNLVQLVLAKEAFEVLPAEKRIALGAVCRDCFARSAVGHHDVTRAIETLTSAGFDLWGGLQEVPLGDNDDPET